MYIAMLIFFVFSFLPSLAVRREVGADVRHLVFTVAILAQGTNRGDALCAALLSNRVVSILRRGMFFCLVFQMRNFVHATQLCPRAFHGEDQTAKQLCTTSEIYTLFREKFLSILPVVA